MFRSSLGRVLRIASAKLRFHVIAVCLSNVSLKQKCLGDGALRDILSTTQELSLPSLQLLYLQTKFSLPVHRVSVIRHALRYAKYFFSIAACSWTSLLVVS